MKANIKHFVVGILYVFMGCIITIVMYEYLPEKTTNKVVKEVNIEETNNLKESIDKIYDAVLVIETYDKYGNILGTGSGFIYKKDSKYGYILTNHHVVEGSSSVKVINSLNKEIEVNLLGSDEYSDLAVLSMPVSEVSQVAILGDSTKLELGDTLFTVGSPLGNKYMGTVTKGILSGKNRQVAVTLSTGEAIMNVIQTDAAINPGNSGGPLLNINGEVIGINSLKLVEDKIEGMGFAIPIELATSTIDKLEKGEKIVRPTLGVQLIDLDKRLASRYGIDIPNDVKEGVIIVNVDNNSLASKSDLKAGDIVIQINDDKIIEIGQFRYNLYKYNIGDTITIKIIRDNKAVEKKIVLE